MFYTSRRRGVAHLGRKMLTNKNAHAINFHQRENRTTNQNVNTANFPSKIIPLGIRRCFDVDIRLKQHRDVDNEISTLFQRCYQDVASTL